MQDNLWTLRWYGFEITYDGRELLVVEDGKRVVHTLMRDVDIGTREGLAEMLLFIVQNFQWGSEEGRHALFALYLDISETPDEIDWWTCPQCGEESFAVPDDLHLCVWCGASER